MQKIITLVDDEEGNLILPLSDDILKEVGWDVGDVIEWIENGQTKICVRVGSEAELMEIAAKAVAAKLVCHVITDAGLTEFGGVPTRTCLAIGPNEVEVVDEITGRLRLL